MKLILEIYKVRDNHMKNQAINSSKLNLFRNLRLAVNNGSER